MALPTLASRTALLVAALAFAPALARPAAAQPLPPAPTGIWIDHTGRGAVEIVPCGASLCGKVVWTKSAADASACGTAIIGGVKDMGGGLWGGGWIYDPEERARYSVELKQTKPDTLRVIGYLGTKLFSETMTWKRPTGELKLCGQQEARATATPPEPARQVEAKPASGPAAPAEPAKPAGATQGGSAQPAPATATAPQPTPAPASQAATGPAPSAPAGAKVAEAPPPPQQREAAPEPAPRATSKRAKRTCTFRVPYLDIEVPCAD